MRKNFFLEKIFMKKVFIDGSAGTTGLRIRERLSSREDIELITLSEDERKDAGARSAAISASDVTFLCLPDDAAREAVALCSNPDTVIIDCSTAHRTNPAWAYGFPELSPEHEARIKASKRIANPGCHASGAIAILYPLISHGILDAAYPFAIHSLTGYSGGGKKMIADYEAEGRDVKFDSPCQYALTASHKHLPEIKSVCSLDYAPAFNPIVSDFYSGMCVCVPIQMRLAKAPLSVGEMHALYTEHYKNSPVISVAPLCDKGTPDGLIFSSSLSGSDSMQIIVSGNEYTMNIYALFCNLGKGASGAAIQNMNIAIGADPVKGLVL
jgi:N-acetyl-gamma-glutamyl-phosphate reductase